MEPTSSVGAPSTSHSSSPTASGSTVDATDDIFVRHRVRKRDTLAGLAVKYNVTVADIKRANGFQTDTAMFGRDIVLIPTKPLPLGPEYAAWAGMIVAHYGKNSATVGGTEGQLRATSAAALSELRGYYSTSNTPTDNRTPEFSDEEDYDGVFNPRGHRRPSPGEVELMARQTSSQSTPGYIEERLRRRGRNAEDDYLFDDPAPLEGNGGSMFSSLRIPSPARMPLFRSAAERLSRESQNGVGVNGAGGGMHASVGAGLNELKDWHRKSLQWRSQLLNKIKRVASQPVMSSGGAPGSMAQAAEAALALATGLSGGVGGGVVGGPKEGRKAD